MARFREQLPCQTSWRSLGSAALEGPVFPLCGALLCEGKMLPSFAVQVPSPRWWRGVLKFCSLAPLNVQIRSSV